MMESRNSQPVLLWKPRSRYGRRDYERFDHISSTHSCAGRGSVGKVEVDCRFMFSQSHWGVIGESLNPGGILYLDLDFRQPPDCRLESATVTVTLAEDDGEERRIRHRSACPVKFTDHYGPKCIRGEPTLVQTKQVMNRTPHLQVLGNGGGGLGINKEKVVQTTSRWSFSGHISSSKDSIWYNRLRWELQENTLERQPTHNNLFHTAFALEHNATRFYMTVQVSGKLAKLSNKIRSGLKFGRKDDTDQEIVTKIEWAEGYSCRMRLDRIAQDLHHVMDAANMSSVPVQMPGALPATYQTAPTTATPAAIAAPQAQADQAPQTAPEPAHSRPWWALRPPALTAQSPTATITEQAAQEPAPPQQQQQASPRPSLGSGAHALSGRTKEAPSRTENPTQHAIPTLTLNELRMAASGFTSRLTPISTTGCAVAGPGSESVSEASSVTLVNSAPGTQEAEGESGSEGGTDSSKTDGGEKVGSKNHRHGGVWLGITAVLLQWLGRLGWLLWSLAGGAARPPVPRQGKFGSSETAGTVLKRRRTKSQKTVAPDDSDWESSDAVKAPTARVAYPTRSRLRARRGPRSYLNVDIGRQKGRQQQEEVRFRKGSL